MRITIPAVRAATGSPFSGLDIRLRRKSDNAVLATETTDAAGVATFKVAGGHGPMVAEALSGTSVGRRYLLSPTGPVGPVDVSAVQDLLYALGATWLGFQPGWALPHDGDVLAPTLTDPAGRVVVVGGGSVLLWDGTLHSEPYPTTINLGVPSGDANVWVGVTRNATLGTTTLGFSAVVSDLSYVIAQVLTTGGTNVLYDQRWVLGAGGEGRTPPLARHYPTLSLTIPYNGGTDQDLTTLDSGYSNIKPATVVDALAWGWVTPTKQSRLALTATVNGTTTSSGYTTVGAGDTALLAVAVSGAKGGSNVTFALNGRLSSSGGAGGGTLRAQSVVTPRS